MSFPHSKFSSFDLVLWFANLWNSLKQERETETQCALWFSLNNDDKIFATLYPLYPCGGVHVESFLAATSREKPKATLFLSLFCSVACKNVLSRACMQKHNGTYLSTGSSHPPTPLLYSVVGLGRCLVQAVTAEVPVRLMSATRGFAENLSTNVGSGSYHKLHPEFAQRFRSE